MNKVVFDEKNIIAQENIGKAEFIVLDTSASIPGKETQTGEAVHPVRRLAATDFKTWLEGGSVFLSDLITFRAEGQYVGSGGGVKFVLPLTNEKRQALGLYPNNIAAIDIKLVGKTTSSEPEFAVLMWKWNGVDNSSYFLDTQVPLEFLSSEISCVDDIGIAVTYNNSASHGYSIEVLVDGITMSTNLIWAAYITFYTVSLAQS